METPLRQSGAAERLARGAVLVFLVLAGATLAFGLGYAVKDLSSNGNGSSTAAASTSNANGSADTLGAETLNEIYSILQSNYVDRKALDANTMKDAAIKGLISSLNDRETNYISPADLQQGALDLGSTYQGIGATVSDRSGQVQIVAPFRDSPAEKAGIRSGDILLEVNGEPTDGWTSTRAVDQIRGPKGTTVKLKVKHTDGTIEDISVTRGEIQIDSVFIEPNIEAIPGESGKKIVDRTGAEATDIGYVNIAQFHDNTVNELRTKMKDAESKGYKGLVVDLRGDPGGLLSATVDVADEFLAKGAIITEVDANGKKTTTSAQPGGILTKLPLVVLIDSGSASGAEVLAAALRDNGRATIVGQTSFGKGTVNRLMPLKSCGDPAPNACGALYLAVSRWLTPKGEQIEGLGIKPDVEVAMSSEDYVDKGDLQLFKAIDILRGQ
ncbi:MAG: S41 family peptidase [Chloroflexi bacterium]|nr:S41 family peptidase [Chloroflexota bacterium]